MLALAVALAPGLAACSAGPDAPDEDDYGIDGPFESDEPLGKADSAGVPGPRVNTDTRATQVWDATEKWEDTDTARARKAGIAWPADSGLNWDQKYQRWIDAMVRQPANGSYYETFTLTTPWGKTVPAPKLECAELAMFLRISFAAWYNLPFYLTAGDAKGVRVYFGHFGARTKTARYKNTPNYAYQYKDYSYLTPEQIAASGWPRDQKLRSTGLYGGGDEMDFIAEGAKAGAYFDEIHLNKRVGHFLRLTLAYFGSMNLASSRNTFNLKPEALRVGDVLLERWQKQGIGHTLVVKSVTPLDGGLFEAQLVSGSMPRRQPKWEDGVASKHYFTDERTGGEGTSYDGDEYVKLGGGIKRFRVTKNIGGYWTNTWMNGDEASWISDTDYQALKVRPATFEQILGKVDPEKMRDALLAMIEDKRNHLRQYPASCSARISREEAFTELYRLMQDEFGQTRAQTDAQHRRLEDYVMSELEYTKSKTCCWNSSTAAMYQIVMDYNQSLQQNACAEPVVFKASGGGYSVFAQYAADTGRSHLWKEWSADESCPQASTTDDVVVASEAVPYCELPQTEGGAEPSSGCADDGYEANDTLAEAAALSSGTHSGLMVCTGNDDYYRFTVPNGQSPSVTVSFAHAEGDLDVELYRDADQVDESESTSDSETVAGDGAGNYTLRVYGYNGAAAGYTLDVAIQ